MSDEHTIEYAKKNDKKFRENYDKIDWNASKKKEEKKIKYKCVACNDTGWIHYPTPLGEYEREKCKCKKR